MKKINKAISRKVQTGKTASTQVQASKPQVAASEALPVPMKVAAAAGPKPQASAHGRSASPAICLELVNPGARQVFVAGSFNGWKPEATPLQKAENGRWVGDLAVNPGRYEYLFVVDGQWLPDPNAKESVQNPFGGQNSVLSVSA